MYNKECNKTGVEVAFYFLKLEGSTEALSFLYIFLFYLL